MLSFYNLLVLRVKEVKSMAYMFRCPLDGCDHVVMRSEAGNQEDAALELIATAKQHMAENHTDVHKTDEEIDQDIRSHMTQTTN